MRLITNSLLSLFLALLLAQAQVFPTLDPNAAPPATQHPYPSQQTNRESNTLPASLRKDRITVPTPYITPSAGSLPAKAPTANKPVQMAVTGADADSYVLGPQDTLNIRVIDMEELGDDPYPVDLSGYIALPRIGRIYAAGSTVEQLQALLTQKFKEYLQEPVVNTTVAEYHSQPVSILGAVETPGVHQIRGNKTLFEVISEVGGLKDDAGNKITITRQVVNGLLPLPNAVTDPSGRYSIADLNIRAVMSAKNPQDNIHVKPYDVITVPKADLIYVIGAVKHPGGFLLQERANMTVLEALSLSQGLDRGASSQKAKIFRTDEVTHVHREIPIDVKNLLAGKGSDQPLLSNDILFIPSSTAKLATYRAIEALVQTGTGIAIYRP